METLKSRRRRRSFREQRTMVAAWQASGLSAEDFATRQGVRVETLERWRKRTGLQAVPTFVPVQLASASETQEEVSQALPQSFAEVAVGGMRARFFCGGQERDVRALLVALAEVARC